MNPVNWKHRRSPRNLTLIDIFPPVHPDYWEGIIYAMQTCQYPPKFAVQDDVWNLDGVYMQRSGEKFISPIMYYFLTEDGVFDWNEYGMAVGQMLSQRFKMKWDHLFDMYKTQYNPLDTYSVTEQGSRSKSHDMNESSTRTPNITEQLTHGHVVNETGTPATTSENLVYGFNSETSVGQSKNQTNTTESHQETNTGNDTTHTTGTDATSRDEEGTESEEYESSKRGNMYRSPAELLTFDRDFWKIDFYEMVFSDLDSFLTLPNYSLSPVKKTVF